MHRTGRLHMLLPVRGEQYVQRQAPDALPVRRLQVPDMLSLLGLPRGLPVVRRRVGRFDRPPRLRPVQDQLLRHGGQCTMCGQ